MSATPSVLVPGLLAVPASGCCDCTGTYNTLWVYATAPMSGVEISGDGCGASTCREQDRNVASACREFSVKLVRPGVCHLVGTATDGRMASTDVAVRFLKGSCCGNYYTTDPEDSTTGGGDTVLLTFPATP
jgi:hypothetical protein